MLVLVGCAPLVWRRSHPIAAAAAAVAIQIVIELGDINSTGWLAVALAMYCLGSYAEGRSRLRAAAAISVAIVGLLTWEVAAGSDAVTIASAIGLVAVLAVCLLAGDVLRRRRLEIATLAARAERAEGERDWLARQRVAEERTRIARDLHDVVAHSVSVMVIQASAARRNLDPRPGGGRRAAGQHRGDRAPDDGRAAPDPRRAARARSRRRRRPGAGARRPRVARLLDPRPRRPPRPRPGRSTACPTGVALSAYRVVQEALTNAHRHAGPGVAVDVRVECGARRASTSSVADDGRGASTPQSARRRRVRPDRHGRAGRRVRRQLRTGPRRSGGWEVTRPVPAGRRVDRVRPGRREDVG